MRDLTQEVDGHTARGLVGDDGSAQRDPLVRIARALELCAMTSVIKATGAADSRERAWRRIRALVEEIDEDAGPQDVVGR